MILAVSALDFDLEVSGSTLVSAIVFIPHLSLFTQVYKWVPVIIMLEVTLQ